MAGIYTDNPFKVLGLADDASDAEVKKAYRKLALVHHPDRQTNDADRVKANKKFAEIAHAYEVLTDEDMRREYENSKRSSSTPQKGGGVFGKTSKSTPYEFRPEFNDPYEIWKRDFREQHGMEYPGAKYDYVDPNTIPNTPAQNRPALEAPKKGLFGRNKPIQSESSYTKEPKKPLFPFRRGNTNSKELVVRDANAPPPKGGRNNQQLVEHNPDAGALVVMPGHNNRPTKVETTTRKEGPITITTTTMTRPDGSTESIVQRSGIPGPKPGSGPKMIEGAKQAPKMIEGPKQHKMIEGPKQHKMIEGPKSLTKKKQGMLTNGAIVPRIKG